MRIGFVGPFSSRDNADYGSDRQIGAIEQQLLGVGVELAKLGNEVYISRNWQGAADENVVGGVRLINVSLLATTAQGFYDAPFPLGRISQAYYILRAPMRLREHELDVLVAPGVLPAFVSSLTSGDSGIPEVFVANNNDIFVHRGGGHSKIRFATRMMIDTINRRCNATIALTRGGQEYLHSIGMDCSAVIPNAVHPTEYQCRPEEGFIMTAGRLVPHKRVDDLILAFAAACEEIPERLVIVGSGPSETSIKRLVGKLGIQARVRLEPFLPQASYRDWLSRCSFFVLPSEAEAFGVSLIEAMACGKSVIARDTIGPNDIITHTHNGLLFHSLGELSHQIKLLSADGVLRTRLGQNARETVRSRYTFEDVALRYQVLLDSVHQSKNHPAPKRNRTQDEEKT